MAKTKEILYMRLKPQDKENISKLKNIFEIKTSAGVARYAIQLLANKF